MTSKVEQLVNTLGLIPHPEGGFFREIFRSSLQLHNLPGKGSRNASTSIYFLLPSGSFSAFHTVKGADEIWHHYLGDPLELHSISANGEHTVQCLGGDVLGGQQPQAIIPADVLQAARPIGNDFTLCGCTVAPGFDFSDFTMPSRVELLRAFPQHIEVITQLTRG